MRPVVILLCACGNATEIELSLRGDMCERTCKCGIKYHVQLKKADGQKISKKGPLPRYVKAVVNLND